MPTSEQATVEGANMSSSSSSMLPTQLLTVGSVTQNLKPKSFNE